MNKYVHIPLYDKCEWLTPLALSNYLYYSFSQKDCQYLLPELQIYGVNCLLLSRKFSILKNEPFPHPKALILQMHLKNGKEAGYGRKEQGFGRAHDKRRRSGI